MWRSKSFFFFMFGVGFVPPSWSSFCDSCCNSLYFFVWLVSPEGIEALCKDVNVDHTDIRMLILAWYVTDGIFFSIYLYLTNLLTFINLCLFLLGNWKLKSKVIFPRLVEKNIASQSFVSETMLKILKYTTVHVLFIPHSLFFGTHPHTRSCFMPVMECFA